MKETKKYYVKSGYILLFPDNHFKAVCRKEDIPFLYKELNMGMTDAFYSRKQKQYFGVIEYYGIKI